MPDVLTHNQTFASPQEALAHYGKKGMKWGVRNEDDSSSGDSAAANPKRDMKVAGLTSRAAKADIHVKDLQSQIDALPPGFKSSFKRNDLTNQMNQTIAYRDHLNKTADAVKEGRLTPNQKRALVGAGAAALVLGGMYLSTKVESGELNSMKLRGQAALKGKPFNFRKNEAFAHAKTPEEVQALVNAGINPGYATAGGQMNCRRCTFAYELRRRGYDVSATTAASGWGQSETGLINALTPGQKKLNRSESLSQFVANNKGIRGKVASDNRGVVGERYSVPNVSAPGALHNMLKQQPSGARGEVVFNFTGFGHSLAYERFGDRTVIFDTQKGKSYDLGKGELQSFIDKWGGNGAVKDAQITRLDNADLDTKFLSRWATNTKAGVNQKAQEAQANSKRAAADAKRIKQEANRASRARAQSKLADLGYKRPVTMHITEWNALRRTAGLPV